MEVGRTENVMTLIREQELIGFWDWDIPLQKKYLSPVIKNMLGYEAHEIADDQDAWINLILKEDQPHVIQAYQKHVASKGADPFEVKLRFLHKNGRIVQVLSKGKITGWDYMGNPVRMIGYDTDITGFVDDYTSLKDQNEQLQTVIDLVNIGVWSYDIYKGNQYWSENFYKAIGYNENEIAPSYFNLLHLLSHPDDNAEFIKAIDNQVKHKTPYTLNIRLQRKDGSYELFETSAIVDDKDGRPDKITGYIIKKKEDAQPAQTAKDKAAEATAPLPSGDFEYDLNRARFTFSPEALAILELQVDTPVKFEPVNKMFTEESQETFQEGFNKAVYNREPYEITLTCQTPNGHIKTIKEKAIPVIDSTGRVTALKGTIEELESRDINPKELLGIVAAQVSDQNKRLLNFAHIASHNLRSHASNLQMILQVLNSSQSEEERKFCLDSLEKISGALSKSIGNLNDLMAVETDLNKARVPIAFKEVLANITGTLSQQIRETNAVVKSDFSKSPIIDYVPAYIESIILNLVSNAIKYRHPQRSPNIFLHTYTENGKIILTVQDNGMGIDLKKHRDKLFRMHQTFHNHPDSRGIGLLITKNQIEAMGGSIDIESEPGTGTTFIIIF